MARRRSSASRLTSQPRASSSLPMIDQSKLRGPDAGIKLSPLDAPGVRQSAARNAVHHLEIRTRDSTGRCAWLLTQDDNWRTSWAVWTDFEWIARRHNIGGPPPRNLRWRQKWSARSPRPSRPSNTPQGDKNPMSIEKFDARDPRRRQMPASASPARSGAPGMSVAMIESHDLGGTCPKPRPARRKESAGRRRPMRCTRIERAFVHHIFSRQAQAGLGRADRPRKRG